MFAMRIVALGHKTGYVNMRNFLKTFLKDESGASAAEYALIIAVVGVGIGAAALVLGQNVAKAVGDSAEEVAACGLTDPADSYDSEVGGDECTGAGGTTS